MKDTDMPIDSTEDLRKAMTIPQGTSAEDLADRFKSIADFLLKDCVIVSGEKEYTFEDIEFYYYSNSHRDIITHPRNTKALHWYINAFGGLDLTFESDVAMEDQVISGGKKRKRALLSEGSYFGGILIRQIRCNDGVLFESPLLCSEELISDFDAVKGMVPVPYLKLQHREGVDVLASLRLNLIPSGKTAEQKVDSIKSDVFHRGTPGEYFSAKEYVEYCNRVYRFTTDTEGVRRQIRELDKKPY